MALWIWTEGWWTGSGLPALCRARAGCESCIRVWALENSCRGLMLWDRPLWDRPGLVLAPPAPRSPWVRRSWEAVFLRLAPRLPAVICQHRMPLGARQPEALGLTVEPAGGPLLMMQGSPALLRPLEGDGPDGEKPPSYGKQPCGLQVPTDSRVAWWWQSTQAGCVLGVFCSQVLGGCRAGLGARPEQCRPEA